MLQTARPLLPGTREKKHSLRSGRELSAISKSNRGGVEKWAVSRLSNAGSHEADRLKFGCGGWLFGRSKISTVSRLPIRNNFAEPRLRESAAGKSWPSPGVVS